MPHTTEENPDQKTPEAAAPPLPVKPVTAAYTCPGCEPPVIIIVNDE